MKIRNFNFRRNQVRMKGKIGLNQYLIYITPFLHSPNFLFTLPQISSKKLFLDIKHTGKAFSPSCPPPPSYAYIVWYTGTNVPSQGMCCSHTKHRTRIFTSSSPVILFTSMMAVTSRDHVITLDYWRRSPRGRRAFISSCAPCP